MGVLTQYKPQDVFQYFETICSIPHGSGNTAAMADYLVKFAEERGLKAYRDHADNVVITKEAGSGYEGADTLILQAHTDMVCEKEPGMPFDFKKDAIRLVVEGDTLHAEGTTLGGDDGISVAMILALLDDKKLKHPKIEALLTTDEEIGMLGAFAFDCSQLTGHKLINLDSEYEGVLMCSCAGGVNACSTIQAAREKVKCAPVQLELSGLRSGHSGVEIDKGRANANALIGRMLYSLSDAFPFQVVSITGGSRETAIAAHASATIAIENESVKSFCQAAAVCGAAFQKEYAAEEPGMEFHVTAEKVKELSALDRESTGRVLRVLAALPDGVQAMSADMPGLVQTSLNFGLLDLQETALHYTNTIRSSVNTQKNAVLEQVRAITELGGGVTKAQGDYPGWAFNPKSQVKDTIVRAYEELYGKTPSIEAVHAGIECGLFADSIPDLDCVSIGPDMADVHTPKEHISMASVARTYELLKKVLEMSR